jgi:C1A family cysteine protease
MSGISVVHDLRNLWSVVRDQGSRPTCLAHAATDVHGAVHQLSDLLSAESLIYHGLSYLQGIKTNGAITMGAAEQALTRDGQPLEKEWPYNKQKAGPPAGPCITRWYGSVKRSSANQQDIQACVAMRIPVLLIIRMTDSFQFISHPWIIPHNGYSNVIHAVIAAGVGVDRKRSYYILIRNSWGPRWGDGGHAWLPVEYLRDKLIEWCVLATLRL